MKTLNKPTKFIAGLAIAGGLAAGAMGLSTGVASADVGPGLGPIATWGGGPPGPGWNGGGHGGGWDHGHGGNDWGPPPPPNYGYGGYNGYNGGGPIPGGWNGGWEPQGGLCIGPFCV